MKHYNDTVFIKGSQGVMTPAAGATVTVNVHGGAAATIYSDDGVTTTANPVSTDTNGRFGFYVADGRYDLVVAGTGFTTFTLSDVEIADVVQASLASDSTWNVGNANFTGAVAHTGTETFANINNVIYADQQAGADACAKINAALTALASTGGTVDARGFITAQTCSTNPFAGITKPFTLVLPYASITISTPWIHSAGNQVVRGSVSVNPATLLASASWPNITISTLTLTSNVVTVVTGTAHPFVTGDMVSISGTSDSTLQGVFYVTGSADNTHFTYALTLANRSATGGTASRPLIQVGTSGSGELTGVKYDGVNLNGNGVVPVTFANVAGQELSGIDDSLIQNYTYRGVYGGGPNRTSGSGNNRYHNLILAFNSGTNGTDGIEINTTLGARTRISDVTVVSNGSGTGTTGILINNSTVDVFSTHVENHTNAISCANNSICSVNTSTVNSATVTHNVVDDSVGNLLIAFGVVGGSTDAINNAFTGTSVTGTVAWYMATGNGAEEWAKDDATKTINFTGSTTTSGSSRAKLYIADQGTACTNGELALSSGWGTTATVTGAVGVGQTCEWTITSSGTGQAANPTITDTLTNALPSASTVCDMRMVGGTGAATLIDQTALSATAPVFTFNGTPVASSTYKIVRRCGP